MISIYNVGEKLKSLCKREKICQSFTNVPKVPQSSVNEKRSITADTELKLQRYFGVEAQFWLNLQTGYDLRMMTSKI